MNRSGEKVVATPDEGDPLALGDLAVVQRVADEQHLLPVDRERARHRVEVRAPLGRARRRNPSASRTRSRALRAKVSTFSTPLFDETTIRTPAARRSSSARRVSAGIWMALQRAGFCDSNICRGARVARVARVDLLELPANGRPQVAR